MHLSTIAATILLPLLALAESETTVTSTSYQTLTKTVTLVRSYSSIASYSNSSIAHYPTQSANLTSSFVAPTASTTAPGVIESEPSRAGAGSIFGGANVAVVAMAGAAAAVLL